MVPSPNTNPSAAGHEGGLGAPNLQAGFSHLDLALARLLAPRDPATNGPDGAERWWQWALALTSRALSSGHTCLSMEPALQSEVPRLLHPADPVAAAAFGTAVRRWLDRERPAMPAAVAASGLIVQDGPRVYLQRLWATECRVAQALATRARWAPRPLPPTAHALVQKWLPGTPDAPSDDQQHACLQALRGGLTVITGGPGTGKTHTAARLIALLQATRANAAPLRVALAAPTGKAAARLRQALETAWEGLPRDGLPPQFWDEAWAATAMPRTIHAMVAEARRSARRSHSGAGHAPSIPADVLIVDEASMLDLALLDGLLQALPESARLVLIGDRDQLSSVEAGAVMADICSGLARDSALVALRFSRRFHGDIGRWARGVQQGDGATLQTLAQQCGAQVQSAVALAAGEEGYAPFMRQVRGLAGGDSSEEALAAALQSLERFGLLAAVRQGAWGVEGLNEAIEQAMAARGLLDPSSPWPHGRILMVTENDDSTGLRNGDVGIVLNVAGPGPGPRTPQFAWLQGPRVRCVGVSRLPAAETAYAMTIHKSQGSEFDHVALVLPETDGPLLSRELLYTGITRARGRLSLFAGRPGALQEAGARATRRMSGLAERLQQALTGSA